VASRTAYALLLSVLVSDTQLSASDPAEFAASLIGRPYVWGAEGPGSFDCSGLTQYVYGRYGVDLPRRAISQSRAGDPAGRRLRRGDLLFFSTDTRKNLVTHVGIYEGSGRMIEASQRSGRVRRSVLSEAYWADRFMFARRVGEESVVRDERARERETDVRAERGSTRRRATMRVLEEIAGVLLRAPRRRD
jgi:hypothetical protein